MTQSVARGGRGDWLAVQASAPAAPLEDETIPLTNLLSPLQVGDMQLLNRVVMAPLTRTRAVEGSDHVPNSELMAEYYGQRAAPGTLLVAEATMAMKGHSTFWNEPGCYSEEQALAWKPVVDAVHAKGGFIFLQLCHGGRTSHPFNSASDTWDCLSKSASATEGEKKVSRGADGNQPVAPSALRIEGGTLRGFFNPSNEPIEFVQPRALTVEEISGPEGVIQGFVKSAKLAVQTAGFDGVEIHAANGYLLDQFLRSSSNKRPVEEINSSTGATVADPYNGSTAQTRCQILLDIVDEITKALGTAQKIGVRVSPLNSFQDQIDEDPFRLTQHLCEQLGSSTTTGRKIAFFHLMRGDFLKKQSGDVISVANKHLNKKEEAAADSTTTVTTSRTALITNMGYLPLEADTAIGAQKVDCVAFGTLFINNPDLVARLALRGQGTREGDSGKDGVDGERAPPSFLSAEKPRMNLYYTHGAEGYTDYPSLEKKR